MTKPKALAPLPVSAIPAALAGALRRRAGGVVGGWPPGGAVVKARGRRTGGKHRGRMNGTEAKYACRLEAAQVAGAVVAWWYEAIKVRLATGAWYTPDFMVLHRDGTVEMVDVKGTHQEEASRVRMKVAAETYPLYRWTVAALHRKKGWVIEEIGPPLAPSEPEPEQEE